MKQRGDGMIRLKVKEVAEAKGLNMSQLARKADIDIRTVRRIYRDPTSEISTSVLDKLATALNVNPSTLIEQTRDE
jgi:transcriptional regulator with XRE-family HTH domain